MKDLKVVGSLAKSNNARFNVCIEDIDPVYLRLMVDLGEVIVHELDLIQGKEVVYEFMSPVKVPSFDVFYGSPIKSLKDPVLLEAISRVWYINPEPSEVVIKQMAEGIVSRFVAKKVVDSQVGSFSKKVPVIGYEEVKAVVDKVLSVGICAAQVFHDRFVFFSKNSKLTSSEKRSLSVTARMRAIGKAVDFIIHQRAQLLNEKDELLYITSKRIGEIPPEVSLHRINTHMSSITRAFIEESNKKKFFKTEKSSSKFQEYLHHRAAGLSPTAACSKLAVSNSTRKEFTEVEKELLKNV